MDCPKCGQDNPPAAKFCVKCGAQVPAVPPPPPVEATGRCTACGTENAPATKFCVKCGKALQGKDESPKAKACPKCGAEVASGSDFCGECGTPLSGEQATSQSGPAPGRLAGRVLQALTARCPECGADLPVQDWYVAKSPKQWLGSKRTCPSCGKEYSMVGILSPKRR